MPLGLTIEAAVRAMAGRAVSPARWKKQFNIPRIDKASA